MHQNDRDGDFEHRLATFAQDGEFLSFLNGYVDSIGGDIRTAWAEGRVRLVLDANVDWTDPESPTVSVDDICDVADDSLWSDLREAWPTWLNVAIYPTVEQWIALVLATGASRPERTGQPPALSLSGAPAHTVIRIVSSS